MARRTIVSMGLGALLFGMNALGTHAAPVNAPGGTILTITCSDGNTYVVATNGGGSSTNQNNNSKAITPAHVLSVNGVPSNSVLATKSLSFTFMEGGQTLFSSTIAHAPNASFQTNGSLLTCSGTQQFIDPGTGQLVTLDITGTGFLTPR